MGEAARLRDRSGEFCATEREREARLGVEWKRARVEPWARGAGSARLLRKGLGRRAVPRYLAP